MKYSVGPGCDASSSNNYEQYNVMITMNFEEDELFGIKRLCFASLETFDNHAESYLEKACDVTKDAMVHISNFMSDNKAKQLLAYKKIISETLQFSKFKVYPRGCECYPGKDISAEYYYDPYVMTVSEEEHLAVARGFFTSSKFCYLHNLIQYHLDRFTDGNTSN